MLSIRRVLLRRGLAVWLLPVWLWRRRLPVSLLCAIWVRGGRRRCAVGSLLRRGIVLTGRRCGAIWLSRRGSSVWLGWWSAVLLGRRRRLLPVALRRLLIVLTLRWRRRAVLLRRRRRLLIVAPLWRRGLTIWRIPGV